MPVRSSLMLEREMLFDHLVYISRQMLSDWNEARSITPGSLVKLKALIDKAEQCGIHGAAWLNLD